MKTDVTHVEAVGEHRLRLTFSDGVVGHVDFAGREWRGVMEPLSDPAYFTSVKVDPEARTISWPNGVDLAPEPLYDEASRTPQLGHRATGFGATGQKWSPIR